MRLILVAILVVVMVGVLIYGLNYFQLQSELNSVLTSDPRNDGIEARAHYGAYTVPSTLIFDLREVPGTSSRADVFRVLLQFAEKVSSKEFSEVELCYRGKTRFILDGDDFRTLGTEYGVQNPVYTMRTFPEKLRNPDGTRAYQQWTGGALGVATGQLQDFNDFHQRWYMDAE